MNLLCILSSLMVLKGLSDPDPIKQFNESMTHYDYLEVDKYANIGEIKKNYRTLALKFHPDKISQMSSNFSEVELENLRLLFLRIQEAYEVLSDPELRIQYDLQQTDPEFYGDHFHMNNDVINEFNKYTQMPYHLFGKYSKYVRAHFYAEFNRPAIPELKGVVKVPIKYIFTGIICSVLYCLMDMCILFAVIICSFRLQGHTHFLSQAHMSQVQRIGHQVETMRNLS